MLNVLVVVLPIQAEKDLAEVTFQLESLSERLEEADGLSSAQVPYIIGNKGAARQIAISSKYFIGPVFTGVRNGASPWQPLQPASIFNRI